MGVVPLYWITGFSSDPYSCGILFVYAGLIVGAFTTIYYVAAGALKLSAAKREMRNARAE